MITTQSSLEVSPSINRVKPPSGHPNEVKTFQSPKPNQMKCFPHFFSSLDLPVHLKRRIGFVGSDGSTSRTETVWAALMSNRRPARKKGPCYLDTILEAIEPNGSNDQRQWAMVVSVANQGNHAVPRWTTECSLVLGRIETIRSWYDNERLASLDEWDFNWRSFFGRQVAGGPCLEGDGRRLSAWSSEVRR